MEKSHGMKVKQASIRVFPMQRSHIVLIMMYTSLMFRSRTPIPVFTLCLLCLLPVICFPGSSAYALDTLNNREITGDVEYRHYRIDSPAGSVNIHMIVIDLDAVREGRLSIEPALPSDRMGQTASTETTARRSGAIAAINGPYFATAGGKTYPLGFTVMNGRLTQLGNLSRPVVGFDAEWEFSIEVAHPQAFVAGDNSFEPIWLWNINTVAGSDAVTLYDDRWGDGVSAQDGVAVAVAGPTDETEEPIIIIDYEDFDTRDWDGEVVEVSESGSVSIPDDGYVLVFKGRWEEAASNYPIGSRAALYTYELPENQQAARWLATLGPWFVNNGWERDYSNETAYNGDITGRADRSAIGITWNDEFFFAVTTGANLNVSETADVLIECNVREAVMCDSGGSAGLWASGLGARGGSRAVPMAFVVREIEETTDPPEPLRSWSGSLYRH